MLDGKTVIVTGAAQGMGRRHLETCVAQGARVVATDLQDERLREVVGGLGKDTVAVAHDVTDPDGWDRVVATALDHFGAVDGLVNNAAIYFGPRPSIGELRHLRAHAAGQPVRDLVGHQEGDRAHAPGGWRFDRQRVVDRGHDRHGRLHLLRPHRSGVHGLSKMAANDLGPSGIRVNSIHPGGIQETGMYPTPASEAEAAVRRDGVALRRAGTTDEVSALVTFLLSDSSSYITGVEHVIDGGSILG